MVFSGYITLWVKKTSTFHGSGQCTKRTVNCISSDGDEKLVECKKPQEFVNVLEFCKTVLDPEDVFFEEIKVAAE